MDDFGNAGSRQQLCVEIPCRSRRQNDRQVGRELTQHGRKIEGKALAGLVAQQRGVEARAHGTGFRGFLRPRETDRLAPFVLRLWHEEQLRELPRDRRESPNKRSPSLTFKASIGRGSGTGVMGSSGDEAVCFLRPPNRLRNCGREQQAPGIMTKIIVIRRRWRASKTIPPLPRKVR
jgi:hypothetical protein